MCKFCGKCGAPLNEDRNICGNCGAAVVLAKKPDTKKRVILAAIGVASLAAIICAVIFITGLFGPQAAAKKLAKALNNGDSSTAYELLSPSQEEKYGSELKEEIKQMIAEAKEHATKITFKKIEKPSRDKLEEYKELFDASDIAIAVYEVEVEGKTKTAKYIFSKEKGKWYFTFVQPKT